nr:unnamed protein product [Digitaria exilis]
MAHAETDVNPQGRGRGLMPALLSCAYFLRSKHEKSPPARMARTRGTCPSPRIRNSVLRLPQVPYRDLADSLAAQPHCDLLTDRFRPPSVTAAPPGPGGDGRTAARTKDDGEFVFVFVSRAALYGSSEREAEMASVVGGAVVAAAAGGGGAGVGATPHVLAVDDSSVDRAIIAAILRSSRFRGAWLGGRLLGCTAAFSSCARARSFLQFLTAVESGKRALELLGKEPDVSMIITDYWMPEMTGYELLKKVKESSNLKQIPVVIMSSENVQTRISRYLLRIQSTG